MTPRQRADRLLVERGLFESRAKAQAAIAAGLVRANGTPVGKASEEIPIDARIEAAPAHPYVSRGGLKLAAALDAFAIDPKGLVCLDAGASTGGFTQVLIERGARHVYAVDVGSAQLHDSLRNRPDITVLENTDVRQLDRAAVRDAVDLIAVDVSFISLKLVLPALLTLAADRVKLIALIKPQFEAGPGAGKKGVIRDAAIHQAVCDDIAAFVSAPGLRVLGVISSPIEGGVGNREFLLGAIR